MTFNIACVGMTHLGLVHAVAFAEKGFNLICYDENPQLIQRLQSHQLPVNEPQLDDLVASSAHRLTFTTELNDLKSCAVIFIAYDVPTDDNGNSDLSVIQQLLEQVKPVLSATACLVLLSQVPPGFTRQIDFPKSRLFYQVETLVFGRAVERALYPERYIIGGEALLPEAYAALLATFECPILKMRYESAELAKISINMFLVASVTTTNTLAEICENIGADWEDIAPTLRLDKRIGQHAYLTPGLGIAGGNLERDLNTIIKLGQQHETETSMVSAWLKNSIYRRDWVLRCLEKNVFSVIQAPVICVLGLAYKPETHSTKNSPSIALINQLKAYQVNTHDPIVQGEQLTHAHQHEDVFAALEQADVVIIMLACVEYKNLTVENLLKHMRGKTIIDPHRVLTLTPPRLCEPQAKQSSDLKATGLLHCVRNDGSHLEMNYYSLGQASTHIEKKEVNYA